ncbi:DUF2271 domain-containing protein [Aquimarina sp. 2201CG14-23]|uniref:DUF2271 domain-containing protein n=1 Tax=Aquimarina mycalae TaxID=3040073 RepID=UPI0024780CBC|nr:DUF2271 domain-containing protein [Aquimarina sp. 2201CG14-23]MDH7446955.1 DUF2271 domain-containing protein [Aquimarina sp. 2201CG14-23]
MKTFFKLFPLAVVTTFLLFSFTKEADTTNLKCMIQMVNYTGEGAYVVISLMKPEGGYDQTLYVQGTDSEWYSDITEWWNFYGKRRTDIDAISGATISGGERTVNIIKIPKDKIDTGYKIRFETAVEDQEYYKDDVEFELTTETITSKIEGKGFIRYIRMLPQ